MVVARDDEPSGVWALLELDAVAPAAGCAGAPGFLGRGRGHLRIV